jgi:hypothetical protein
MERCLDLVGWPLKAAPDQCRPVNRRLDSCISRVGFMVVREDGGVSKGLQRIVPGKIQGAGGRFLRWVEKVDDGGQSTGTPAGLPWGIHQQA